MRKIKLTIIAIAILVSAVLLSAHPVQLAGYDIDLIASMMRESLDLSYSQTIHIRDILTEIQGQIELTKPDNLTNPEIIKEDADNFRLVADEKIKSVLSEHQKSKYDQMKSGLFKIVLKHSRPYQM